MWVCVGCKLNWFEATSLAVCQWRFFSMLIFYDSSCFPRKATTMFVNVWANFHFYHLCENVTKLQNFASCEKETTNLSWILSRHIAMHVHSDPWVQKFIRGIPTPPTNCTLYNSKYSYTLSPQTEPTCARTGSYRLKIPYFSTEWQQRFWVIV